AAAEMRERAGHLVGRDARKVLICTFHALGVRLLREDGQAALQYAAQAVRPGQREEASQQETFLRSVPATLSALGVSPEDHQLTLRLYLLEIATRYVDALTHGATPALTRRTEWVLGLLEHHGEPAHHALVEGRS
ncbi:MAG TPA: hypothetical protein PL137_23615, partial [Nocardioides sp.]|nr:hypothetical protein [Nocardioides sp.]